jgi:hypothetical protein
MRSPNRLRLGKFLFAPFPGCAPGCDSPEVALRLPPETGDSPLAVGSRNACIVLVDDNGFDCKIEVGEGARRSWRVQSRRIRLWTQVCKR